MKYIIYKMVQPSCLVEIDGCGYVHNKVLQKLDISGVDEEHPTMESAIAEIHNKKHLLKFMELTIIPVLEITWDEEIRICQ